MSAARDHAGGPASGCDGGAVAGDVAGLHLETDQPAAWALGLDFQERLATDELALLELDGPAETRFVGVDGLVHVVAPEAKRGLKPRRVARAQARGQDTLAGAALEDGVPNLADELALDHDLEAVLPGVPRARDDRGDAGDVATAKSEVGQVVEPVG